ncbi:MAG: hypothetical protein ABIM40_00570 [Pseudomonadota bacterium]
MNHERAAMLGLLAEARKKREELRAKCEWLAQSLRQGLNTALTNVEDLAMDTVWQQMTELSGSWAELVAVRARIERLERELGG